MPYKGVAKGKIIELEDLLPYPEGQPLSVSVEPWGGQPYPGSPAAIRQVMHEPPHLKWEEVDELERVIQEECLSARDWPEERSIPPHEEP